MEEKPGMPDFLRLTREKLDQIAVEQSLRREQFGVRGILSALEQKIQFARQRETAIRASIDALMNDRTLSDDATESLVSSELERLAEVLAEQGRYGDAIEIAPRGARVEEYRSILQAIERDDFEECECEDETRLDLGPHPVRLPRHHIADWIRSDRHGEVPLIRCSVCGHLNARPAPPSIRHISDGQARNDHTGESAEQALARVLGGEVKPDSDLLRLFA